MKHDVAVAAEFAETLVSQNYRHALSSAFEDAPNPDAYFDQRRAAEELIVTNLRILPSGGERTWELRRQAALTELGGTALGEFGTYIHMQGGESAPANTTPEDLVPPNSEIVRTNTQILGHNKIYQEPIDFMAEALEVIESKGDAARGPGNYATIIKFFSDKYRGFPSVHLDSAKIKSVVDRCMEGFVQITEDTKPNFIEMTNLYFAIRTLPRGTFDKKYTEDIVGHSLDQLPTYHANTLALMIACLSKLDLSDSGESAATLIDLALRKSATMERTTNMVHTVRTVANLPPSPAAERTFNTFLQLRNNLEQPQDLEGLDTINYALVHITKNVITDPELSQKAKTLAEQCAALSLRIIRQKDTDESTTPDELAHLKSTVRRIIANYNQI